ncbi:rod shape-determining protein RodA [Bacillus sp. FJAT-47783]|uniref:rod shape-determining protein RodA n=1 Tax=Bacillus sp. FJAT-47783 TaxID=2922712 RepID=UPI001FADF0FA|nr:rod shape-determining protein RodA [Bacillus sp. FJAT-47783]
MDSNKKEQSRFDYQLASIIFLLFCVSCIAIYGAQLTSGQYGENFLLRQIIWYIVGSCIVAVVMFFDSEQIQRMAWYMYGFGIFLLLFLMVAPESIARRINGAKAWFTLPGFSFQPAEFVKVFLIILLSSIITNHNQLYTNRTIKTDLRLLLKIIGTAIIPILLVIKQPDLGTALVMMAITAGLIFVSGISWKIIITISGVVFAAASSILYLVLAAPQILEKYLDVKPYQFGRIYAWLNPEGYKSGEAYHLVNSLKAIGSGQITGKGIGKGQVYIPENHTDFIFSVIGEQFGFIGTSIVLSLYFLLIYHLIKISLETYEAFNSYICAGVISLFVFHAFQNAGMTIGLLPITGIPLPFISYGGSSIMGSMFAIGLIFSIRWHHKVFMFSNDS